MPLIRLETTARLDELEQRSLCAKLSRIAAEVIGKPEQYVQAVVADGVAMLHGGTEGPAAFVDVRSIGGLDAKVNRTLAARICGLLGAIGIPGERVYLNFTDVSASSWGHDGATFG
jgi:phenylpyruvate tautomerase PptA (4-oxalocrotonate tautomerase family)